MATRGATAAFFIRAARAAIGTTDTFFAALFSFDDVCRGGSDDQYDNGNDNIINKSHIFTS